LVHLFSKLSRARHWDAVVAGEGYQMKITAVRRILETRMSARM
jgi:hypothetical protein